LTIDANAIETLYSLANTLLDQDQFARAQEIYRQILTLRPEHSEAHTNLLFSMNFTGQSVAEYVAEARRYGRMVSTLAGTLPACDPGRKGGAPLRVGLVSGDLREHPVGHFLEGTIANLDRSRVELIAYSTFNVDDAVSARMRSHFSKWTLLPKGDKAAAQMIRADGIDILVDLAGHTGNNRLPLFAWRPAPVQASWLGYFASTGVEQMDYFIADPITTPETHRSAFTEQVWHLPCTRLCFTAPDIHVPVSDLPALSDGVVTFGCFNSLSKMNESVVGVWARLLHAAPQSRLFLKAKQFKSAAVRAQVLARFQDHAIPAHRLVLEGPSTRAEYLAAYGRVDIGLDPFPFTGATTTAESLWMGVPVLTLAGDRLVARQGMGLLTNAGLGNWIATDEDDYIGRAVALASDLPRLALLRAGLRSQVRQSPLFDGARLARDLEDALERMWDVHAATRHFEGRVSGAA
jgi:predicted O-linked N-acetylglucosamine transferase (SPINDLY family)